VTFAGQTHPGLKRKENQDNFWMPASVTGENDSREGDCLFLVADGVGGRRGGKVASQLACESFRLDFVSYPTPEEVEPAARLNRAFQAANRTVFSRSQADEALEGMATTLVATFLSGNKVYIGSVGDSRILRVRAGALERLTRDHSLVAEHIALNLLSPEEAENVPYRNVITRAIGKEAEVWPDIFEESLQAGDFLVLCSDGLTREVNDQAIATIINQSENPAVACQAVLEATLAAGGSDNVTVIVTQVRQVGQEQTIVVPEDETTEPITLPFRVSPAK
jgi:protein phosphatase